MNNHYTKDIFSEDRLTLFNYFLYSPQLFTSRISVKNAEDELTYLRNDAIRKASLTLVTFTKFIWNELFTSWDRLLFEFNFPENFSSSSFPIICRDNYKLLSPSCQQTYNRLLFLLKNDSKEGIYIYLLEYITTIFKKFEHPFPNLIL